MSQLRRGRWRWSYTHRVSQQEPDCRTRDRHREHADQGSPTGRSGRATGSRQLLETSGESVTTTDGFSISAFSRCATRQQRKPPVNGDISQPAAVHGSAVNESGDMSTSGRKISNAGGSEGDESEAPRECPRSRSWCSRCRHPRVQPGGHQDGKTVERQSAHEHDQEVLHSKHRCRGCPDDRKQHPGGGTGNQRDRRRLEKTQCPAP